MIKPLHRLPSAWWHGLAAVGALAALSAMVAASTWLELSHPMSALFFALR
jgi:hypothetical protein